MRRITLILAVVVVMVALVAASAGTTLAASDAACNQGTEKAHHSIPEVSPGIPLPFNPAHAHVPQCD